MFNIFNKKSIFSLLATTALLCSFVVSLAQAQDGEGLDLNDSWEDNGGKTPNQEQNNSNIAQQALATHNRYRDEVGVSELQWSSDLANSAQQWANELAATNTFKHSDVSGVGENIWAGSSGGYSVTEMVDNWGSEKKFFTPGVYPDVTTGGEVGHYTQIVWKNSTEVGCAVASSNGSDYFVCQYKPPGNVLGQPVY